MQLWLPRLPEHATAMVTTSASGAPRAMATAVSVAAVWLARLAAAVAAAFLGRCRMEISEA